MRHHPARVPKSSPSLLTTKRVPSNRLEGVDVRRAHGSCLEPSSCSSSSPSPIEQQETGKTMGRRKSRLWRRSRSRRINRCWSRRINRGTFRGAHISTPDPDSDRRPPERRTNTCHHPAQDCERLQVRSSFPGGHSSVRNQSSTLISRSYLCRCLQRA